MFYKTKIKYRFLLEFVLVTVISAAVLVVASDSYRGELYSDADEMTEQTARTAAAVVDADGRMVAIAGVDDESREAVLGEEFANRRYVRRALAGETYITPHQHSSGLGRWIVNSIICRHDGSLSIRATETGTTIEITLPRATDTDSGTE